MVEILVDRNKEHFDSFQTKKGHKKRNRFL